MARPSKPASLQTGAVTKKAKAIKTAAEKALLSDAEIRAPEYLTDAQRAIFDFIVEERSKCDLIGGLDVYVLADFCVAADRIRTIDEDINRDPDRITDQQLRSARDMYAKSFYRGCNELGLSPQSRAKFGNLAAQAAKENPLLRILEDE